MKVFLVVLFSLPVVTFAGSVNVLSSFYSPDWFPNGLAWDGNHLWLLGGHYDTFYKINTGGTVISHFTPSEPGGKNGDGAAFDGTNLWGMFIEHTSYPGEVYESGRGIRVHNIRHVCFLFHVSRYMALRHDMGWE
jgi:hypothetical protein